MALDGIGSVLLQRPQHGGKASDPKVAPCWAHLICFKKILSSCCCPGVEAKVMKQFVAIAVLAPFVVAAHSAPSINIGAMYEYMDPGKSTLLKRVRNSGDSTAFVKVSVTEIVYANDKFSEQAVASVADTRGGRGHTLVASPARSIIPAGGAQATRFLHLGNRDQEQYYRVRFEPVVPQLNDEFGLSLEEEEKYKDSLAAAVTVMTGYGAVLIVPPENVSYNTETRETPDEFVVHNAGNAFVLVDDFYDCETESKECKTPLVHHVRPQVTRVFKKEAGRHYRFNLVEGNRKKALAFGK